MTRRVSIEEIEGIRVLEPKISRDNRGSFIKYFDKDSFASDDLILNFDSLSIATNIESGIIRGLHFQAPPFDEEKMIVCFQGRIYDVLVDLRNYSKTLGKWATIELSEDVPLILYLPKGIAHGYQTLSQDSKIFYGLTSTFNPEKAHSLDYADRTLNVEWPLPATKISSKDLSGISLELAIHAAGDIGF